MHLLYKELISFISNGKNLYNLFKTNNIIK